jgi:geranylgeranyl diphosphate synthase type I
MTAPALPATRDMLDALDSTMRALVDALPDAPDFSLYIRYALGWADEHGAPYARTTGKRIRPLLVMLSAEAAGGRWHDARHAAAAVELLHNFSLIHDDIQDESDTRHNRPTVWRVWGRANAINAGDLMFTLAYRALEAAADVLPASDVLYLWNAFNTTNIELTRGQHLDMRFEHQAEVSPEAYISMIGGKSAALIAACSQMGAWIGARDRATAEHFAAFGYNLGLAFQIRDDILGIWGDPAVTGKSAATDILTRKKSLPVLLGLQKSADLRALYAAPAFGPADVTTAIALLEAAGAYEETVAREEHAYQAALAALDAARPGDAGAVAGLRALAGSLFGRSA